MCLFSSFSENVHEKKSIATKRVPIFAPLPIQIHYMEFIPKLTEIVN